MKVSRPPAGREKLENTAHTHLEDTTNMRQGKTIPNCYFISSEHDNNFINLRDLTCFECLKSGVLEIQLSNLKYLNSC